MKVQLRKILAKLLVLSIIITSLTGASMPVQASTDRRIIDITTGNSNYFLQEDGTIYDLRYKRDAGFTNVKKIVSGLNTIYAVTNDGKLLVNGSSSVGLLGLGDAVTSTSGEIMTIPIDDVENFFLEDDSAYAVTSDGLVYSWGNKNKYLGHSGYSNITWVPTLVPNVSNVEKIIISKDATYAIQKDGIIKAWGANTKKTVSNSAYSVSSPVTFTLVSDVRDIVATTGSIAIYYLLNDGSVVSKTDGSYGHSNTSPIQGAKKIAAGFGHAIALMPNGDVYTVGRNNSGQVGIGNTTDTTTYTKLSLKGVVDVFAGQQCTFAVLEDGSIYAWGFNINAILGFDSGNTSVLSPTKLSDTTFIVSTPPVITIEPYNTSLTNKDITVNATTDKGTLNKSSHTFIENGSFDFIAIDESTGLTATETVTITNIDKIAPITPIITSEELNSNSIAVSITYPSDAIIKQYKIDDGVWQDYTNFLTITTNSVVYARGQDLAGNWSNEAILGVKPIQGILDEIEDMLDGVKGDTITDKIGNILGDLEKAKEDLDKITADNEALQEELDSLRAYIESLKDIVFGSASGQTDAALKTKLEEVFAQLDGLKADSELLNRINTLLGTTNDTIEHRINELLDDESSLANIVDMLKLEGYLLPNSTSEELKNVIDDLIASDKALDSVLEVLGGSSTKGTVVQDVQDLINRVSELETFVDSLKSELGLPVDATLDDILATIDSLRGSLELPDDATFEEIIEAIEKLKSSLVAEKEKSSSLQGLVDGLTQEIENIKGQLGLPGANNAELIQKIIEMQNEILDLKNQLDGVNSDLSDLLADKARLEKTISDAMDSLSEYEGATLQERIQDIKNTVSSLESDLAIANGKISDLESELDALKKENTTLKERIDELEGLLEAEELENQELQGMIEGLNADLREISSKLGIPDSDKASIIAEIGVIQQRIIGLTSELEASNNVISGLKTQITDLSNEIQSAMDSLSEYERDTLLERIEAIKDRVFSLESQLANANSKITNLESEIDELRRENGELKDKVEELEEEVADLEEKLASEEQINKGLQDTIIDLNNALKEIAAKLSIPDSDKASIIAEIGVLQQKIISLTSELADSNNIIIGLKAQNTALTNEIQSAMDSLSEYERDTLLERIDAIKDRVFSLESQLAFANSEISDLVSELDALKKENTTLKERIDELEGLLEAKELENQDLQGTIDGLNADLREISSKLGIPDSDKASIIAEIGVIQQRIIGLTSELEASNNVISGLKTQITDLSNEIQSAMDSLSDYERDTLLERIDAIKDRVSSLESQLANANSRITNLELEIDELRRENGELKDKVEELEDKVADLEEKLASEEQNNKGLQDTITALNNDLKEIAEKLGIADVDKESILLAIGVLQQQIIDLVADLEVSNNIILDLNRQISDLSSEIKDAMDSLSEYDGARLQGRINSILSKVATLNQENKDLISQITNLLDRIKDLEAENKSLSDQLDEANSAIDDLRDRLDAEIENSNNLQDTINGLTKEIERLEDILDLTGKDLADQILTLQNQLEDLKGKLAEANSTISDLNQQIGDLSKIIDRLQKIINESLGSLSEYEGAELLERIEDIKNKKDKVESDLDDANQRNTDLNNQLSSVKDQLRELQLLIEVLKGQLEDKDDEIARLLELLKQKNVEIIDLGNQVDELTKESEEKDYIIIDLQNDIDRLRKELEGHVCSTPEVSSKPSNAEDGDIIIKKEPAIDNIVKESVIDSETGSVDANEGWELSNSLDNDTIWTDSLTPRTDNSFTGLYSFFDNNLNNVIGILSVADSVDSKNGFMKYTFYARKVNDKSKVYVCSVDVEVTEYITPETLVKSSVLDDPRTYSIENSYETEVNGSIKFNVKANYGNVGRKEVRYQVVPENMDFDPDGTWILVKGDSFIVEEQKENFRVYIKFIDKAGNYTVDKTVGFAVANEISDSECKSDVSLESNVSSTNSAPVFTLSKSIAENGTYLVQLSNLGKDDKVTYTSSNTKVATVTKNGEIVAKSKGVSRVTGTVISKNRTYKFVINVTVTNSYPTTMNIRDVDLLSNSDATLTMYKVVEQGKSTTFKLSGIENGKVSYSSSDRTVATVSSSGVVTGKKKGFTTVHIRVVVDNIIYDYAVLVRVDDGTPNRNISKYLY